MQLSLSYSGQLETTHAMPETNKPTKQKLMVRKCEIALRIAVHVIALLL